MLGRGGLCHLLTACPARIPQPHPIPCKFKAYGMGNREQFLVLKTPGWTAPFCQLPSTLHPRRAATTRHHVTLAKAVRASARDCPSVRSLLRQSSAASFRQRGVLLEVLGVGLDASAGLPVARRARSSHGRELGLSRGRHAEGAAGHRLSGRLSPRIPCASRGQRDPPGARRGASETPPPSRTPGLVPAREHLATCCGVLAQR